VAPNAILTLERFIDGQASLSQAYSD
jgi:hypothetical protein